MEVKNSHLLALDGPPMWQSDGTVVDCNMCQKAFDWLNRRHHVSELDAKKGALPFVHHPPSLLLV